jgi:hypothetical protein
VALLCCVLALLQYRWIGEIGRAEQDRLRAGLPGALVRLSEGFNTGIEAACAALQPSNAEVDEWGRNRAYAARFAAWRESERYRNLFRATGIAIPAVLADEAALNKPCRTCWTMPLSMGPDRFESLRPPKALALRITVADRGTGIPPEEQPYVFDRFFRGRHAITEQMHGTGLGLHLVKQIVEAHGGNIGVVSDVQTETKFILTIPAAPQEAPE